MSNDPFDLLATDIATIGLGRASISLGRVTGVDPVTVEGSDGDVELQALGSYRPIVGDTVLLARQGMAVYCLGGLTIPTSTRPPMTGTVTAVTAPTLSVSAAGSTYTGVAYPASYAPVVGNQVIILWQEYARGVFQGAVVGKSAATPSSTSTSTTPLPGSTQTPTSSLSSVPNPLIVKAVSTATWRNGSWRTDTPFALRVMQGSTSSGSNSGFWFYGSGFDQIRGHIVDSVQMHAQAISGVGAGAATVLKMGTHTARTKPASAPALSALFDGPALADGQAGWFPIATSPVQSLANGTAAGLGIAATTSALYQALAGVSGGDPLSGALRIYHHA